MTDEEFIKLAYESGIVKDVSAAFEEYPPEKEWHKGQIENILLEENIEYGPYEVGDIVFVKRYNCSDGKIGYDHLFVIISQNNLAVPIESFGLIISSRLEKLQYKSNILLKKDDKNGLNKNSIVKTDNIYKIDMNQILFKIGKVDLDKVEEYKNMCFSNLKRGSN